MTQIRCDSGVVARAPLSTTVTVELPMGGLVALCEILGTLERKAERGDWWASRMRNLGDVPAILRAARPVSR